MHLFLGDGRLWTRTDPGDSISAQSAGERIEGRTPAEIAARHLADWRTLAGAEIAPDAARAIREAIAAHAAVIAPLRPLRTAEALLAYLDIHEAITCRQALPGFTAGHRYPAAVRHRIVTTRKGRRLRSEKVLLVILTDDDGRRRYFGAESMLSGAWDIPPVPDIATLRPEAYQQARAKLESFESALDR